MKNDKVPLDEQETFIHYDYKEQVVHLYTTRSTCYSRLVKVLGKPDSGGVFGADWYFPFEDRESIRKCSNISILLTRKK